MKLTPIDIKKHTFNTAFRGFAPEEVEAFLDTISNQWSLLLEDLDRSKHRISELEGETKKYKDVEGMLHQTLAQAQHSTNSVLENAKREAELIRQEAQLKSAQIIERAKIEVSAMADDVRRLETQKRELTSKLRLLLSSQLEILSAFNDDEESFILSHFASKKHNQNEINSSQKNNSAPPTNKSIEISETPNQEPKEMPNSSSIKVETSDHSEEKSSNIQQPYSITSTIELEQSLTQQTTVELKSSNLEPSKEPTRNFASIETLKAAFAKREELPFESLTTSKPQTIKIDVPVEPTFKSSSAKKTMNIDDILDSLE